MLYRERLWPPVTWWVMAAAFALSLLLAIGFYLGPVWGTAVAAASLLISAAALIGAAAQITVTEDAVTVGRAMLETRYVRGCTALDKTQTRRRAGPAADARAYLVLRPYLTTAVEISLADPADPAPYWLVATRRPARLAAAVSTALAARSR